MCSTGLRAVWLHPQPCCSNQGGQSASSCSHNGAESIWLLVCTVLPVLRSARSASAPTPATLHAVQMNRSPSQLQRRPGQRGQLQRAALLLLLTLRSVLASW